MGAGVLTFDEPSHTYRLDGRVVPSVTQILKRVYPNVYSSIPPTVLDRKARLGTAVHRTIELWIKGVLDEASVHAEVRPYLDSFLGWWDGVRVVGCQVEKQLYSQAGYAMTRDFFGEIDGQAWLIDWKITATRVPTHDLQITGYNHGADRADVCGCLYLMNDGSQAQFVKTDTARRLPDWLATLRVFNLMETMK